MSFKSYVALSESRLGEKQFVWLSEQNYCTGIPVVLNI